MQVRLTLRQVWGPASGTGLECVMAAEAQATRGAVLVTYANALRTHKKDPQFFFRSESRENSGTHWQCIRAGDGSWTLHSLEIFWHLQLSLPPTHQQPPVVHVSSPTKAPSIRRSFQPAPPTHRPPHGSQNIEEHRSRPARHSLQLNDESLAALARRQCKTSHSNID